MRRGDIFIADLEPVKGSEANKQRPVVIVSNDESNAVVEKMSAGIVTVVPLTTNTSRVYRFQVLLEPEDTGLAKPCKAQGEQIRAITTNRLKTLIGRVSGNGKMLEIDEALRIHLQL
jgi:mRNA interferase MazF